MMRCLTVNVLFVVATWVLCESTAFIVAPSYRCPQRRSLREQSHLQLWHSWGVAASLTSIGRVNRKMRSLTFMVDGGQGDGGRWALAGAMMVRWTWPLLNACSQPLFVTQSLNISEIDPENLLRSSMLYHLVINPSG